MAAEGQSMVSSDSELKGVKEEQISRTEVRDALVEIITLLREISQNLQHEATETKTRFELVKELLIKMESSTHRGSFFG